MSQPIVIVGGGPAGIFAAIQCAELCPDNEVVVLEKSSECLSKVKVSGGGRCNVTHNELEPKGMALQYPRGGQALIGPFRVFGVQQTVEWFRQRGVLLKTEADGRIFPDNDDSSTIVNCLLQASSKAGVTIKRNSPVKRVEVREDGGLVVLLNDGSAFRPGKLLLASGGVKAGEPSLFSGCKHHLEPSVPSLFTFNVTDQWLLGLAGLSVADAEVSVPGMALKSRGAVLITHWGLSGPAVLRLSAWGARVLHANNYRFSLHVNWLPGLNDEQLQSAFEQNRLQQGAKLLINAGVGGLPGRLWRQLVNQAGLSERTSWSGLTKQGRHGLMQQVQRTVFSVFGKSTNKDEFVTCGGVSLSEVNFRTMESKLHPGLYFAGEILDIDGVTGGFNFQAAWTTGWIAGQSMANAVSAAHFPLVPA